MPIALKRYLACLGIVCVLMALYSSLMSPWLEAPVRAQSSWQSATKPGQLHGWWSDLFPADAWQNQNPMVIQTVQGTLLFQKLERLDSGETVRLFPLTLIIPTSNDGKADAVGDPNAALRIYQSSPLAVVIAPEGADIQFREAPDWASGTTPPVSGGLLRGPIQIAGIDPKEKSAPVQWSIHTANVRIEGRRVWTNNDVEITAGNSVAIGKDLSIFLKQDLMGKSNASDGPWGLLHHLELKSIKQVSVSLPPGGLWKDMKLGPAELAAAHANLPARLLLICKGIFQFDFDSSLARLSDNVQIEHRFENEPQVDSFMCHELSAQFSPPAADQAIDPTAIMIGPLQLESIDALGIDSASPLPAVSMVGFTAPNIATQLVAKRLRVQLDTRRFDKRTFTLESHNGRSSEGSRQPLNPVALSYMGTVFHAVNVQYAATPNQEHLGWLLASGAGDVETSADSAVGQVKARWQKQLLMQPAEGFQSIALEGNAALSAADRGRLESDVIKIALRPFSSEGAQMASLPAESGNTAAHTPQSQWRVDHLDATGLEKSAASGDVVMGDVVLGNPTQNVHVKKLHLDFVYPASIAPTGNAPIPGAGNLELSDAAGRPMRQWVGPPGTGPPAGTPPSLTAQSQAVPATPIGLPLSIGIASGPAPAGPGSLASSNSSPLSSSATGTSLPVLILGKELHSKIVVSSPKPWIDNLLISGPVVISRDGPPTPESPAWHVAGGELRLASDASDKFDLQIVGNPARITFGDGWIEGPIIRLNQRTGHVWMDQPGALCVPASLMSSRTQSRGQAAGPQLLQEQSVEWMEPIKCRWQGRMLFNGLTANIEGDIEFDGYARTAPNRLLFVKGSCQSLEVRMTENINLGNPGKTSATVHSITLRDSVNIRTAQTDSQRQRMALEEILLPEVTFEVATNTIRGSGPGELFSQHQATGGGMGGMAGSKTPANPAVRSAVTLQGLNLKFRDSMEMKLAEKRLEFVGKVEVGLGPISTLDQRIDLDNMRILTLDQSLLNGDLLVISDASDVTRRPTSSMAEGAWEFKSMGNVFFENKSPNGEMVGKAAVIKFIQAKDLLIINGDTRIPAEIRIKQDNGAKGGLAILSMWQGAINTRTMGQEGELQLAAGTQFVPNGVALPSNWKTGSISAANLGTGAAPATNPPPTGATPITPTVPRPRDALQQWPKQ